MNDYYTVIDGQGNFVFFDNADKEVKFDNKVARRSGMTTDLLKARELKEKATKWLVRQCEVEVVRNKTMQDYFDNSERTEDEKEQHKAYYQKKVDDLLSKKFSLLYVQHIVVE